MFSCVVNCGLGRQRACGVRVSENVILVYMGPTDLLLMLLGRACLRSDRTRRLTCTLGAKAELDKGHARKYHFRKSAGPSVDLAPSSYAPISLSREPVEPVEPAVHELLTFNQKERGAIGPLSSAAPSPAPSPQCPEAR